MAKNAGQSRSVPSRNSLVFFAALAVAGAGSLGPLAGAQTTMAGKGLTVSIAAMGAPGSKSFKGWHVADANAHQTLEIPEAFVIVLKSGALLRSTAMQVSVQPNQNSSTSACWAFVNKQPAAEFQWCSTVKAANAYARVSLTIKAGQQDLPISEVHLLQFRDASARVDGSVKGSPVVSGDRFYGFEHPLSSNVARNGEVDASLHRELALQSGQSVTYSAVIGTSAAGQLRRSFLIYLENERPRRYKPFLHYNSWFDLGYTNRFDEAGALDRVHAFGTELVQKRKVQLDSYLFDDGWDDPNTLWGFDSGFPNGFTKVGAAAATYQAGIGVWLSPWGGYDKQKEERIAYGKAHGYEILNNGYALSGPKYYKQFEQTCLTMVDRYHVNQFKFDGTGNADRVFPGSSFDSDFDAAIHLIGRLRAAKPGLFINLTTGTTPSPFWLFYADSIWRGGEDHDFAGVGSPRQRWISYRDGQTYKNIVQKGPLFPLNSLMLHGIIYAKSALDLTTDPKNEFADEVQSYFGSGTQLQEMYITPKLLTSANWDTLAAGARWSRANAETLKDVHWIGGDPGQLQVYGWAAWSTREGIITLRNPSDHAQSFSFDIGQAFELPTGAAGTYTLLNVWKPGAGSTASLHASKGHMVSVTLAPFEVLTLAGRPS